jgi:DNA mismatch endonuclease (patch repair protein)
MADVFTKAKRSEVMSRIRSHGNKDTELALAAFFRRHGITGWRRQVQIRTSPRPSPQKRVNSRQPSPGCATRSRSRGRGTRGEGVKVRPDFIFPKLKLAIFVDGCFWHGCPWHGTQPKGNRAFWKNKIANNKLRDRRVNRTLRSAKWRVLRIWEHALRRATQRTKPRAARNQKHEARLLGRIRGALNPASAAA